MKDLPQPLSERTRALLPFLVTAQGGKALQFLLPFLSLACGSDADDMGLDRHAWLESFTTPEVKAPVGHVSLEHILQSPVRLDQLVVYCVCLLFLLQRLPKVFCLP
jgi:hypothetical protein